MAFFKNKHYYYIYNKGIEGRNIFMDDADRLRFLHNLFEYNDEYATRTTSSYHLHKQLETETDIKTLLSATAKDHKPRRIVAMLAFALLPNAYFLLLEQKKTGGITTFLRKLGTGYTNYFNKRHKRNGHLFQGKAKVKEIEKKSLLLVSTYVHLQGITARFPNWQTDYVPKADKKRIGEFLAHHPWTSALEYFNNRELSELLSLQEIKQIIGKKNYLSAIEQTLEKQNPEQDLFQERRAPRAQARG